MTNTIGHIQDAGDPWALAQHGYDVDKFYVRSTDGKGHAENVQCRISPSLLGELAALVASHMIPEYRTVQDFIRDAIVHRAKYVTQMIKNDQLERTVDTEIVMSRIEQQGKTRKALEAIIAGAQAELAALVKDGNFGSAATMLEDLEHIAETMMEPYGTRLNDVLDATRIAMVKERRYRASNLALVDPQRAGSGR